MGEKYDDYTFTTATAIKQQIEQDKAKMEWERMMQLQAMLQMMNKSVTGALLGQGGPPSRNPKDAAVAALNSLAQAIERVYAWGTNAKDPLGNFLPEDMAVELKHAFFEMKKAVDSIHNYH